MNVPLLIARRYLFARKTHRAIGIISAVSAAGIAIGTAVLVVILSVFNGFDGLIRSSIDSIDPDLKITPASGKALDPGDPVFMAAADWAEAEEAVESLSGIIEEQVYLLCEGHQTLVLARGVDDSWLAASPLKDKVTAGNLQLGNERMASGIQLSQELGLHPRLGKEIRLYFPSRTKPVSLQNPAASLESVSLRPGAVFSTGSDYDGRLVIVPLAAMQELLDYETACSSFELRFAPGTPAGEQARIEKELTERLGSAYTVRDRVAQNRSLFKMLNYEKGAIFLILLFVVIIVAFNIFGSLSMLILEKQPDIATLGSLGADRSLVRRIFFTEGVLVSGTGLVIGLLLGVGVTLLQQYVGLVRMPGNFAIEYYPVVLRCGDLAAVTGGVAAVGLLIAFLSSRSIHPLTR